MEANHDYVHILISTLEKQADVLKDILALTKEQRSIAEKEDFDEVMLEETLNRKEVLIARLNELDDGFASVYSRVRREITENKKDYQEVLGRLQGLIKECTDLGVEIKVAEERNRDKLAACFTAKHKEYGVRQTAASVASRYHQTMHNMQVAESYFINEKN